MTTFMSSGFCTGTISIDTAIANHLPVTVLAHSTRTSSTGRVPNGPSPGELRALCDPCRDATVRIRAMEAAVMPSPRVTHELAAERRAGLDAHVAASRH